MHQLIDSHCHWDDSRLQALQPHLWQSCISQGVQQLVVPGTQWAFFARQIAICEQNPLWHLALGLHPYFSDQHSSQHVLDLAKAIVDYKPVAVGEIGLDFALDTTREGFSIAEQERWFIAQVKLAKHARLPVIVHSRKANDRLGQLLRQLKFDQGGIVHGFSGSIQQAQKFTQLGFKIGFGGTLTYDRAQAIRRLAMALPLTDIVLETDAPDMPMAEQPKGQPNQPDKLPRVLEVLGVLRPESIAQIAMQTMTNTLEVLRLNSRPSNSSTQL
ncbi:TatD family hydrolase [Candidatus Njordibacter sp. Uisw_002]|jgi:TatD DNase family protein|uniref:TatD family hydrolase n=1 Tax=Candidatus Njordibacter sp. Uisw_002 TaxID=3230971 RepID=UPI003D3E0B5A|tara:strand:- start:1447 stop:2262 length:816 start_codon:yes stop_codon:yes gene_type:complete